ncbi:MAG: type II/IV secretion system ATPase subunit [Nanoarchaeota archaeon]
MFLIKFYEEFKKEREYKLDKYTKALIKDKYYLIEEPLTENDKKNLEFIKKVINKVYYSSSSSLKDILKKIIKEYQLTIDDFDKLLYYLEREFELGKITSLLNDRNIEDISCEGSNKPVLIYHSNFGHLETNIIFNEEELKDFIFKLSEKTGKIINIVNPILQGQYKNLRIEATLKSDISKDYSFTLRKFREKIFTPFDLIEKGTIDFVNLAYLWLAIEYKKNILIAGGTATGKTTLLNAISLFIKPEDKIISIEDTPEIRLAHKHFVQLIERNEQITMYDLLKSALRQRPDYIIVGEVRGKEANVLFQAMATGHSGLATIHANDIHELEKRLTISPINLPKDILKILDLIVFQGFKLEKKKIIRITKKIFDYKVYDYFSIFNPLEEIYEFNNFNLIGRISNNYGIKKEELINSLLEKIEWLKKNYFQWLKNKYDYKVFQEKIKDYYNAL